LQYKGLLSFVIFIKPSNAKSYTNLILGLSELVLSSLEADDAIFLNILNRDREIALLWYVRLKHILLGLLEIAYDQNKNKMIEEEGQIQKIAEKLFEKTLNIKQSLWSNLEAGLTKNPNLDISFRKNIKEKNHKEYLIFSHPKYDPFVAIKRILLPSKIRSQSFRRKK